MSAKATEASSVASTTDRRESADGASRFASPGRVASAAAAAVERRVGTRNGDGRVDEAGPTRRRRARVVSAAIARRVGPASGMATTADGRDARARVVAPRGQPEETRMRAVAMPFAPGPTRAPRDVHPGALARITRSLAVGEDSVGGCDAPLDAL